jgi:DNA-binding protein H-NS
MTITNGKSVSELLELQQQVQDALNEARAEEVEANRTEFKRLAARDGLSLEAYFKKEIAGTEKQARHTDKPRRGVADAKYASPNDSSIVWSGKGPKPAWFAAAIKAGFSESDMLISRQPTQDHRSSNGHASA